MHRIGEHSDFRRYVQKHVLFDHVRRAQTLHTELEEFCADMQSRGNGGADGTRTRDPRRDRPVF